jgi:hypothetical protein
MGYEYAECEQKQSSDEIASPATGMPGKNQGTYDFDKPFDGHPGNNNKWEDEQGEDGVQQQKAAEAKVCDTFRDAPPSFPEISVDDGKSQQQEAIQQKGQAGIADDDQVGERMAQEGGCGEQEPDASSNKEEPVDVSTFHNQLFFTKLLLCGSWFYDPDGLAG